MRRRAGALLRVVPLLLAVLGAACSAQRAKPKSQGPEYRRVRPPVAFELLRDSPEDLVVIDLRTPEEYFGPLGHLRGARNIPLAELGDRIRELWGFRQQTILVYCRNDQCGDQGATELRNRGFENPVLMVGGLEAWVEDGFRTEGVRAPVRTAGAPSPAPLPVEGPQPEQVYLRLSDGAVVLRQPPPGFYVAGRVEGVRFEPGGQPVQGRGALCSDLVGEAEPLKAAWRDLADGSLHVENDSAPPTTPKSPVVRGCVDPEGRFHPGSLMIEYH